MSNYNQDPRQLKLSPDLFRFVSRADYHAEKKLDTKPIGYFKDALIRFRKNKASVAGFVIIMLLVLYAIIGLFFTNFSVQFRDGYLRQVLPKNKLLENAGFWDGAKVETLNQIGYDFYDGIGQETGNKPIKKLERTYDVVTKRGKREITTRYYDARVDSYFKVGVISKNLTVGEYNQLVKWQNATGIQVIYPAVDISKMDRNAPDTLKNDPNIYYLITPKGEAIRDAQGNLQPVYRTGNPDDYKSLRLEGDPGNWSYYVKTQTGHTVRVSYYEYYQYIYSGSELSTDINDTSNDVVQVGKEPLFWFGTNQFGQDIFTCLAEGARFSFLLAIFISVINLSIGAVIGAMEGYYGGALDMIVERFKDILSGVPFMITVTLFQLHLANKVGPVVSLLFAFVLTGWVGMSSLVRTQFYRFKHQEYVLAARTLGAKDRRIITKHITPNAIGTVITSVVLVIPGVIFSESILSYLGIVNLSGSNTTSVGTLLAGGQAYLQQFPHIIFFPAIFISLLEISFNLFGNGLRDAFNPSLRGTDE